MRNIRSRWKLRGWHFTPLENLEGENEVVNSLYLLKDSVLCGLDIDTKPLDSNTTQLLENLEELYERALLPWEEFRTVFECGTTKREFFRWPYGTYSAKIRREARYRFWELKTTSRFAVNEIPNIHALQQVNWPCPPISERHVASLAAMVCITEAIEALESVLSSWRVECRIGLKGKSFDCVGKRDHQRLESLVFEILKSPNERASYIEYVRDAWNAQHHAELWLSHCDTLDFHLSELEKHGHAVKSQTVEKLKHSASTRASVAAKSLRKKTSQLTVEVVAEYFNAHVGQKFDVSTSELAEKYGVSERTVSRRRKNAEEKNLLS